eukprot:2322017-Ditylum_brightwellii.AAC.1
MEKDEEGNKDQSIIDSDHEDSDYEDIDDASQKSRSRYNTNSAPWNEHKYTFPSHPYERKF